MSTKILFQGLRLCKNLSITELTSVLNARSTSQATAKREAAYVTLSENCVKQLKKIGDENGRLRVIVTNGGCSGFQYLFDLDRKINQDDRIFKRDGAEVIVDQLSLDLLNGSVIDFQKEMIRSSFRVVDNPRAEMGCSCGVSFSIK